MKIAHQYTIPSSIYPKDAPSVPLDLLIGDQWREGAGKRRIDVDDPSTGEVLTSIADADISDAIAAVDAAEKAAASWAATPPRVRSEILRKCFEKMVEKVDWLTHLISLENGKALPDARSEVLYAAEFFRWYAEEGVRVLGEISVAPSGANRILVQYEPIGISLMITPWNFPAAMATRKIAPALAAGCTCILKPATETPLTAFAVAAIMLEAGVPPGVVNVLTTSNAGAISKAILDDRRVRKLSFTGSTEVGRILLHAAADNVISCSMELGGNAPFLVFDDANLSDALDGAMVAKMRNGGEACTAANRFYVQNGIYDAFAHGIVDRMSKIKVGVGYAPDTGLGPMINSEAVSKISSLVEDAVTRGGKVLLGGAAPNRPGFYYPPTVIGDVQAGSDILREEIFGPVVTLTRVGSQDEAIRLANDTEFGLAAYLYTSDLKRGMQVSEKLQSGMVALNRGLMSDPAAPFGGVKQSGLGREGSHHGLLEFSEAKYIAVSW